MGSIGLLLGVFSHRAFSCLLVDLPQLLVCLFCSLQNLANIEHSPLGARVFLNFGTQQDRTFRGGGCFRLRANEVSFDCNSGDVGALFGEPLLGAQNVAFQLIEVL